MTTRLQHLTSYLPPGDGWLPSWLLFLAITSLGNSIQAYTSLAGTRQVYAGSSTSASPTKPPTTSVPDGIPAQTIQSNTSTSSSSTSTSSNSPVTPLSARTFGTWTAITAIVRLYAAYHITNPVIYELGLWTFVVAWAHFMSEWFVFGTARWGRGLAGPVFVSTGTAVWMWVQWGEYVK